MSAVLWPVADLYYFVAHDDRDGKPRLHPRAVSLGLAAALLGELVLTGRIEIQDGAVYVVRREPPGDALAHSVLAWLISQPQHSDVKVWLAFLAETAAEDVARRLLTDRRLEAVEHKRLLGTRTSYVPSDINMAAWQSIRIANLLIERRWLRPDDALLAGLIAVTGLSGHVLWDSTTAAVGHAHLAQVIQHLEPSLRALVTFCEAAVGQAALAPR